MGEVVAIRVAEGAGLPMRSLEDANVVPGQGLEGDRYALGIGFYSPRPLPDGGREVTLFEVEVLEQLEREHGIPLSIDEHRRNVTTRGVRLLELIGQRFRVGAVVCEGIRECTPCVRLEELTGKPVNAPLVGRGGLRAKILKGGAIRVGDPIVPEPAAREPVPARATQGSAPLAP